MIVLSQRLQMIANLVPHGARLADIGSDHALLPTYLALNERIAYAIAGEVRKGPFESARKQVETLGLGDRIDVRLGNGLQVFAPNEVDTIVIAGMGGSLITRILAEGNDRLAGVNRLILQPNVAAKEVREWLMLNEWQLEDEMILDEDGYIYEILVAVPNQGQSSLYEPLQLPCGHVIDQYGLLMMGPYLLRSPNAAFVAKWERELHKLHDIMKQLSFSRAENAQQKALALRNEITLITEVLACLQKGRLSSN